MQDLAIDYQGAQNAIDVATVALWVFAGVAALAGLVAITIVSSRQIALTAGDQTTHRALGLTRGQRVAVGVLQTVPVTLVGALFAVVAAAAASPLFPIGVARRAEPDLGVHVDGTVLALGTVAVIAGSLLIGFLAALLTTRSHRRAARTAPGPAATVLAAASRAGVHVSAWRARTPTRSASLGDSPRDATAAVEDESAPRISSRRIREIESLEQQCLDEVNRVRRARHLLPLELYEGLLPVARDYSRRMAEEHFFSHNDPDGRTVRERVGEADIK